jgi:hypothetical protein
MITPLAYLGYHDIVDEAPYDHINAAEAIRLFVDGLPRKEDDYLDALRAYTDTLYGRMLGTSDARYFLDKTPAYALILKFLTKLYPEAKYIALTRHPLAVMSSYANSFFNGNWQDALDYNPVVNRYVPAIAQFLRDKPVALQHVAYETLVSDPARSLQESFAFLDLPDEPEAVNYGQRFETKKGRGDPFSVHQHDRPVTGFTDKWVAELKQDANKQRIARDIIERLDPEDLATWGYEKSAIFGPLEQAGGETGGAGWKRPKLNSYALQRRILVTLKRDIHQRPLGRMLKRMRYYCDVLLRE